MMTTLVPVSDGGPSGVVVSFLSSVLEAQCLIPDLTSSAVYSLGGYNDSVISARHLYSSVSPAVHPAECKSNNIT